MDNVNQKIKDIVNKNNIVLFMKGTPDSPQCGFSMAVSNILKHLKVKFEGVNVLESNEMRQGIKDYTDWPTIPQLYIKGNFIGGCDIVKEMFESGELKNLLQKKDIWKLLQLGYTISKIGQFLKNMLKKLKNMAMRI